MTTPTQGPRGDALPVPTPNGLPPGYPQHRPPGSAPPRRSWPSSARSAGMWALVFSVALSLGVALAVAVVIGAMGLVLPRAPRSWRSWPCSSSGNLSWLCC
ncbi:hypothetical protein [Serinibacter arcticus]|uniref:hypothetical protein n=1 Tax=Serinibacter arcticus TaxID=1655435 RepID=UPI0011B28FF0|nr:hypothetical protein [Serinibacter arcticus]